MRATATACKLGKEQEGNALLEAEGKGYSSTKGR